MTAFDTLHVAPGGALTGRVRVPGDKSISHRSVMLGALAEGTTEVRDCLMGEDVRATMAAFRALGVEIEEREGGRLILVHGRGLRGLQTPRQVLDLGNSGTSIRLMSGIIAGSSLAATLTGDSSLRRRPMRRVTEPLGAMGAVIRTAANGTPPLEVEAGHALHGIDYVLPVASAQVKSAILLAGLFANGTTAVTEPAPTRDHTERMLAGFGVTVVRDGARAGVAGGQSLKATKITVPADISSAAFFLVGASIAPGSELVLEGVGVNPTRTGVIDILGLMGADITAENAREVGGEPVADLRVKYAKLRGIDVPPALVPLAIDEFPALFIAAAAAEGVTTVREAEELRHKESDRIATMAAGLETLGVPVETRPDGIRITGGPYGGGRIDSHGDHRIAMSFAIAALRAGAAIDIADCANIATSFPDFVPLARGAGLGIAP
ncbi:MAG: 3-phosphoshikimate 1-carboxyvinyltransferase [Gammaproteobacteria bacterium]|nr:3-phosphoshikimate 1-carboxyvinyltransferase [Gammaproteobacteria bacterium]MBI5614812.1 3-phosphoshikimate 1-carboxyvinyltransferase [Gammaproteobacteria bacterium]